MKSKYIMLLIAAIWAVSVANAQSNRSEMITGSWKLKNLKPQFPANALKKEIASDRKIIADDEKDFKKSSFVFTKDRRLLLGEKNFTWKLESDDKTVKVMKDDSLIIVATIVKLSAHQLIFTRPDEGMIVTYTLIR